MTEGEFCLTIGKKQDNYGVIDGEAYQERKRSSGITTFCGRQQLKYPIPCGINQIGESLQFSKNIHIMGAPTSTFVWLALQAGTGGAAVARQ